MMSKEEVQRIENLGFEQVGSGCFRDSFIDEHLDRITMIGGYIALRIGDLFYIFFSSVKERDCGDCVIFKRRVKDERI